MCRCDITKYSFCHWVVNIWNSFRDYVVEADSVNSFKVGWIITGPIKSLFFNLIQNEQELEVYQSVCKVMK